MSKQNDIAEALRARLETIRTANGYATEAGQYVYRGRRSLDPGHLPALVLHEGEDQIQQQSNRQISAGLPFTIQATARVASADHPNITAHDLVADIQRCIFADDLALDGITGQMLYEGRTIGDREDGSNIITATVMIQVPFVQDLANP